MKKMNKENMRTGSELSEWICNVMTPTQEWKYGLGSARPQRERAAKCVGRELRGPRIASCERRKLSGTHASAWINEWASRAVATHLRRITHAIEPWFEVSGPQIAAKARPFKRVNTVA